MNKILKDKIVNINFKNLNKIYPKNIIKKMRQEDLRSFYLDKKKFMMPSEKELFTKKMLGYGSGDYPSGNEFLVEKKGGKLSFINFDLK